MLVTQRTTRFHPGLNVSVVAYYYDTPAALSVYLSQLILSSILIAYQEKIFKVVLVYIDVHCVISKKIIIQDGYHS